MSKAAETDEDVPADGDGTDDGPESGREDKTEDDGNDILKFTMLINKYNSDLEMVKNWRTGEDLDRYKRDVKCTMFFNKEVTIRPSVDPPAPPPPSPVASLPVMLKDLDLTFPREERTNPGGDTASTKRNDKIKNETVQRVDHGHLRPHNSLTNLSRNLKLALLRSKNQSMTTLETVTTATAKDPEMPGRTHNLDDRGHSLQVSKSTNDSNNNNDSSSPNANRRSLTRFKKGEEGVSASDSRLLHTGPDIKRQVKKSDRQSRGDSTKETPPDVTSSTNSRKQVQWKAEVDVIYFSSHLGANGDKTGEVIGRVMEPLREEWEQQRKGFYAKIVPYHIASHVKDRFISLLKI